MKQFDAPKKNKCDDEVPDDEDEDVELVLDELEGELEDEDIGKDGNWEFDMRIELTEEEIDELEDTVKPVRHVLTKVNWLTNILKLIFIV